MSQWYSVIMTYNGNKCFDGYFITNTATNVIQAVYLAGNPCLNILSPTNSWANNNNVYMPGWLYIGNTSITYMPYFSSDQTGIWNFYGTDPATTNWAYEQNSHSVIEGARIYFTITPLDTTPFVCFLENSQILTNKGYRPIQELRKGDLIKTLRNDFVPIDMIGARDVYNSKSEERIKDQLYVCSQDKFPEVFQDLVITGCHCILVDDFKEGEREKTKEVNGKIYVTDNKYRLPACVDERTRIYEKEGICTIYHIALENTDYYMNYGIYANGLLVETCSKRYLKELSQMKLLE